MDAATKKLFALVAALQEKLDRLDDLEKRLSDIDNGKLAEIKKAMERVETNSRIVVSTVESHGDTIGRLEKTLTRLNLRCPLLKPDTGEFPNISERVKLKDE
jgi:ABC-type phosphate transport system auxiliary subunit